MCFRMTPQKAWVRCRIVTLKAFKGLSATVYSHMVSKCSCPRRYKVTLKAFIDIGFASVCYHMCFQSTCLRWCIVTLVTFVWLFSTVCFQMYPQMACLRGCIVTLVAFVCLFSTVGFHMFPQIACVIWCIRTLVAFAWFFSALCHSHWNLIGCAFTIISWFKILIHFQLIRSVLSFAILVSNWKHISFGL